jgi:hypothetical protein
MTRSIYDLSVRTEVDDQVYLYSYMLYAGVSVLRKLDRVTLYLVTIHFLIYITCFILIETMEII